MERFAYRPGSQIFALALAVAGASCAPLEFTCEDDPRCKNGEVAGVCVDGNCAFPSEDCPETGLAWASAGDKTGKCVPADGTSSGSPSDDSGDTTALDSSAGSDTTLAGDESSTSQSDTGTPAETATFVDDVDSDFEEGVGTNVHIGNGSITLASDVGLFESRVFDAETSANMVSLSWTPGGTYGKPLPDESRRERGYATGNVNMAGNVLLFHFDHPATQGEGSLLEQTSGNGLLASATDGPVGSATGVLGGALRVDKTGYVSVPIEPGGALEFGISDFTFSMWVRRDEPCPTNEVFMGADNREDGEDTYGHLWLGCTNSVVACGSGGATRIGGSIRVNQASGEGPNYCSVTAIDDGAWHHATLVKQGHETATVRLYVDGQLEYEESEALDGPILFPDHPDFGVGGFSHGRSKSSGDLDEVAVWRRALDEDEVEALYRRGATRLAFQVRSCEESDCSDGVFVGGSDLRPDAEFVDPPGATVPGSELTVEGLPAGRYFQYKVVFEGIASSVAPELRQVRVTAELFGD